MLTIILSQGWRIEMEDAHSAIIGIPDQKESGNSDFLLFSSVSDPDSFFTYPDPGKKTHFFKGNNKIFVFNQKSRYYGIFLNRELLFRTVSFIKISENHEFFFENGFL